MNRQQDFPLLEIFTFGGLHLKRDGKPILGLKSQKAKALLAYLAGSGSPKSREILADLFWEGRTQTQAQSNLRTVLSRLRNEIGAYLSIDRYSVGFKLDGNIWIDVDELIKCLQSTGGPRDISSLETACQIERTLDLYQGEFLEGFYIRGSNAFENWVFREREFVKELVISQYQELIKFNICIRNYQSAIALQKKLLLLDPLLEPIHRQLMFLLFWEDQRESALDQFEKCKRILKNELNVEPSNETTALSEVLLEGKPVDPSLTSKLPELTPLFELESIDNPIFVGREDQLTRMDIHLGRAINGAGQAILISGEAGSGKTALASEFARSALEKYPDLLIASGRCNSISEQGEPYFPIHQILENLFCVTTSEWPEAAERLREAFPQTLTTTLTVGPDLIDTLIDPEKVMAAAFAATGKEKYWLEPLQKLIASARKNLQVRDSQFLIDMFNCVLASLSNNYPLLIILDDLQWADNASCNLLFDLIRNMGDSRICLILLYRSSEVFAQEVRHNLFEPLIYETKVHFGDTEINMDSVSKTEARAFVDAYLDSELNQLDEYFRNKLFKQTQGHPLFTIELLRTMQDRGDLQQVKNEGWVATSEISWDKLPARVEGVIEARLARLDDWSREILEVASVIGEEFDVHILSKVFNRDERETHRILVKKLSGQHRLVLEVGEKQNGENSPSLFRFSHKLFQQYLYSGLGGGQQQLLHEGIANAIEICEPENLQALAYHYSKTEDLEKAIEYLIKVADKARSQYATKEARDNYLHALAFINETDDQELASRTWMKLALTYQNSFEFDAADQTYAKAFSLRTTLSETIREQNHVPAPHPLRFVTEEPTTIDPTFCGDVFSGRMVDQLFSSLVTTSPRGNVLPDVARNWDVLDGGRRYVFHLRGNSFWSDGVPVTAGDFEFASKRALNPKGKSPIAVMHYDIKNARLYHTGKLSDPELIGIRSIDDHTLEFELENPAAYFLQLLGTQNFYPIPRHSIDEYGDNWTNVETFVSNGAFLLDSRTPGEFLLLKKNPRYHGRCEGNLQFIEITFTNQVENRLEAYLDGDFDILQTNSLSRDQQAYARQYLSDELYTLPEVELLYVVFDTNSIPLNNPRVRRAITFATNRKELISQIYPGIASPAAGGLLPPGIPGHAPNIALPYDPDSARFLLTEAGFPAGKGFPILEGIYTFCADYEGVHTSMVNHLKEMWLENLGIKVNWTEVNLKEMINLSLGNDKKPSVLLGGWAADYPDPHNFFVNAQWNRQAGQENLWNHPEYDCLIQKAKGVLNQDERIDLYTQADRIIVEEAPIIPLSYWRTQGLQKPWVKGLTIRPGNSAFFKDVIIEEH